MVVASLPYLLLAPLRTPIRPAGVCAVVGRDVLGDMDAIEASRFLSRVRDRCLDEGIAEGELARFDEFCEHMRESVDAPVWTPVFQTGQSVLTMKHYPRLSALPSWDREPEAAAGQELFPWLRKLEAQAGTIAEELRGVCNGPLPTGYERDHSAEPLLSLMDELPGLSDTERELYVPGFDERPTNGYYQIVLVANDERQQAADLFPKVRCTHACGACAYDPPKLLSQSLPCARRPCPPSSRVASVLVCA
jgi:hypothetical protein